MVSLFIMIGVGVRSLECVALADGVGELLLAGLVDLVVGEPAI
jgi:hypothetical protein